MTQQLPIRSVHHLARVTRRLDESRAFYRDVLGFREIPRPNFVFPGAWLFNYGLQIHLIVCDEAELPEPGSPVQTRGNHLALAVTDIDEVERILSAEGIPHDTRYQAGTSVKQVFFRDPDGHLIEVGAYGPTRES